MQFQFKIWKVILPLLLFSSICHSQSQKIISELTFFDWEYAIDPTFTRGSSAVEPNLGRFQDQFFDGLKEVFNIRSQPKEIEFFVEEIYPWKTSIGSKSQVKNHPTELSFLVFTIAEPNDFVGVRSFIFNNIESRCIADTSFLYAKNNLSSSSQDLINWLLNIDEKSIFSPTTKLDKQSNRILEECILRYQIKSYQKKFENYSRTAIKDSIELPRINLSILFDETEKFLADENKHRTGFDQAFLGFFDGKPKNKNKYPRIHNTLKAIRNFDLYFKKLEEKLEVGNVSEADLNRELGKFERSLDSLLKDDHQYYEKRTRKRENKVIDKYGFNLDGYTRATYQNMHLVSKCKEILTQADSLLQKGDLFGASSLYMQIISNEDINGFFNNYEKQAMNCSYFKYTSYQGMRHAVQKRYQKYNRSLEDAIKFDRNNQTIFAQEEYLNALTFSQDLSVLAEKNLNKIKQEKNKEEDIEKLYQDELLLILQEIKSEADKIFGQYDLTGDLSNKYINTKLVSKNAISFLAIDSIELRNGLEEINFRYGQYESVYQDELLSRIARLFLFIETNYSDYIKGYKFYYNGSSDGVGFTNPNAPLKLKHHKEIKRSYKNFNAQVKDKYLIQNLERITDRNQVFYLQDLASAKTKAYFNVQDKDGNWTKELLKVDPNYAKNLALAFLRAKFRHDYLMEITGLKSKTTQANNPNKKPLDPCECNCDCTIEAEVHKKKGFQFRGVDMQFTIEFFSSKFEMDLSNNKVTTSY